MNILLKVRDNPLFQLIQHRATALTSSVLWMILAASFLISLGLSVGLGLVLSGAAPQTIGLVFRVVTVIPALLLTVAALGSGAVAAYLAAAMQATEEVQSMRLTALADADFVDGYRAGGVFRLRLIYVLAAGTLPLAYTSLLFTLLNPSASSGQSGMVSLISAGAVLLSLLGVALRFVADTALWTALGTLFGLRFKNTGSAIAATLGIGAVVSAIIWAINSGLSTGLTSLIISSFAISFDRATTLLAAAQLALGLFIIVQRVFFLLIAAALARLAARYVGT
ncbi:MAG: hypothetical protein GYB68_15305 [Chloroflexi bacterium]|nr:hypothetical protein [Chloroflexota bacterium]